MLLLEQGLANMSLSDEGETLQETVTAYLFCNARKQLVPFSDLPVQWNGSESSDGSKDRIFLRGFANNGLQKLCKQVVAWKYDLSESMPEISVLSKDNNWIKLQKPYKSYKIEMETILVTLHCLHFFKRTPEASGKALWLHLFRIFSSYSILPSEDDLMVHVNFIREAVKRDEVIAKSKFLAMFLDENRRKRNGHCNSIEEELFDTVCAICDNGGSLVCCEGKCLRSFHSTLGCSGAAESHCESIGLPLELLKGPQPFICWNCQHNQHQCYVCGELGSSDNSSAGVFQCSSATCGHFYHPQCVAPLLLQESEAELNDLQGKIAAGEPFTCPAHKCYVCKQGENEKEKDLQFSMCRRCPKSYHRKCLPREIIFDDAKNFECVAFRGWDGLLRQSRALIYCLDHDIVDELLTPARNIKYPGISSLQLHGRL